MSDNEIKIQSAIWELVTTEVDYIHALQTVTDVSVENVHNQILMVDFRSFIAILH